MLFAFVYCCLFKVFALLNTVDYLVQTSAAEIQVFALPAFSDNYIWLISNGTEAVVVDPGQAQPVLQALQEHNLRLSAIFITHEHWDHVNGVDDLCAALDDVTVYGPAKLPLAVDYSVVQAGQVLSFLGASCTVLALPGHTAIHVGYWVDGLLPQPCLFCGDTLFAAGCGRVFTQCGGRIEDLFQSLQRIQQLPADTVVFPAHEYTLANVRFAYSLETAPSPEAQAVFAQYQKQREAGLPTLPSSVQQELETNPFLRAQKLDDFKQLRQLKDVFS